MDVDRIPSILLQTFLTVAEAGQISEAARRLHLSQPTVTGHIRRLEANLETTLFIRSANGVSLTERGAHLRERVQDVFAELEQILRELDRTQLGPWAYGRSGRQLVADQRRGSGP
jgi:DNA-binding transcriptional LysR family regulator